MSRRKGTDNSIVILILDLLFISHWLEFASILSKKFLPIIDS